MMEFYLGIDVGSVTTKMAVLDAGDNLAARIYMPTEGKPIEKVQQGLVSIREILPDKTIRILISTSLPW